MAKKLKKSRPMAENKGGEGRGVWRAEELREEFKLRPKKETLDEIRERQEASMLTEERLGRSRIG